MNPYQITCSDYIQTVFSVYDSLGVDFNEKQVGQSFVCAVKFLVPRHSRRDLLDTSTEWDIVDPSYTVSNEPIEVVRNAYGELVVCDGHHRLKHAISTGKEFVTVKLVGECVAYAQ